MLPACHCPEGKSVCTHEVWSWSASQTQQVCRSILRTAKCSWVLQFVHAHGVPNSVCLHEGTLSAGVKLYFTLLSLKALLIFTLKEKKMKKAYLALVHIFHIYVWCSVLWINPFHHTVTLLSSPLPKVLYPNHTFLFLEKSFQTQQSPGLFLTIEGYWKSFWDSTCNWNACSCSRSHW